MANRSQDRLGQIWSGFAEQAKMDLSGTSVDQVMRPAPRREDDDQASLDFSSASKAPARPEGCSDPIAAAFSALQAARAENGGRRKRKSLQAASEAGLTPQSRPSRRGAPSPHTPLDESVFADIAFTESKVSRPSADYISYAAARQDRWRRRKKRFFGLF